MPRAKQVVAQSVINVAGALFRNIPRRNAPPYSIVGIVIRITPVSIFEVLEISIPFPPQGVG
jgi:hypothetical protein